MINTFRQIRLARALIEFGDSLRYLTLSLGIIAVRNSPADLAVNEVLETMGFLSAGLVLPFFVDRFPRMVSLVIADAMAVLTVAAMAYGIYLKSLPILFMTSFAMTFNSMFHADSLAAITADYHLGERVESSKPLIRGFSILQIHILAGGFLGSLFGTKILNVIPLWNILLLNAVTYLITLSWIGYLVLTGPERKTSVVKKHLETVTLGSHLRSCARDWLEGFQATLRSPAVSIHVIAQGMVGVAHGLISAATVGHYKTTLNASDRQVGAAQTSNRFCSFLGILLAVRTKLAPRQLVYIGTLLITLGYAGMGLLPFYGFVVAYGVQQFGNSFLTPTNRALCLSVPDSTVRGRIASFRGAVIDLGTLLGNLLSVGIIATFGTSWAFFVGSVIVLSTVILYARVSEWK